jgi:hypothetical protein
MNMGTRAMVMTLMLMTASTRAAMAQTASSAPASTREETIAQAQAAKAQTLHPYAAGKSERVFVWLDTQLRGGLAKWHPFFDSAYSGGGFTLGAGRSVFVSDYSYIDARGSYTIKNYKRIEAEFVAPRLFNRRGALSVTGGWREATQVGFYGIGPNSGQDNRTDYLFQQPYASALLTVFPTRKLLMLRGGVELTEWSQKPGEGSYPSIETHYTPETLPGLGESVTYTHTQGTVGVDSRPSPGYARRGGYYAVTLHDYADTDERFGFGMVEYEAIQHLPILRETWVLSLHADLQSAIDKDGQQTPFFMLPALGGGSSLRGYSSWRFRDRNALLLQAEWRVMVNRYLDLAFFYDAGKVTGPRSDLDLKHLKDDAGVGFRFHGPFATPLRIELAKSREGFALVFAASPAF